MSDFVQQNGSSVKFNSFDAWVILSPIELSIKNKIEAVGTPLKDWDINIYRGILTGYNEAFIISSEKRNEILANCITPEERQRTDELIRPILRGRDIKKYGFDWAGLWLIATFPSKNYDIENYPALEKYLLSFAKDILIENGFSWVAESHLAEYCRKRLEQSGKKIYIDDKLVSFSKNESARKKTSNKWFETQDSISYWDDFNNPKVVWARLMRLTKKDVDDFPRFALVPEGIMTVDSLCFFSGKEIEKICYLLNSEFATYYFLKNIVALDTGGLQMRQQYIEEIPLPHIMNLSEKDIYKAFEFTSEEIDFIKDYISRRKAEIIEI